MLNAEEKKLFMGKKFVWLEGALLEKTSSHRNKGSLFSLINGREVFQERKLTIARGICSRFTT